MMTTNGSAPAGGCVVFVSIISAIARPTAAAITTIPCPKIWYITKPTNVEIRCPPMMFRGCDNGASHTPNASTQLAPNGAIIHASTVNSVKKAKIAIEMNPPTAPIRAFAGNTFNGLLPFPFIFPKNAEV
ncbi:hypothetical protein D3C81_1701440 [compost metagenome]